MTAIGDGGPWQLTLLGEWRLQRAGVGVNVTLRQQRLIAALAILGGKSRRALAASLWPASEESHAAGNLRAGLWQISHELPALLVNGKDRISLSTSVWVDWHWLQSRMTAIRGEAQLRPRPQDIDSLRRAELLPGWYEEFVWREQERLDQLRLETLEVVSRRLYTLGDLDGGREAAWAAAAIDPLRESAQRLIIEGDLLDGNYGLAVLAYHRYCARLESELGISPSPRLGRMLQTLVTGPVTGE
jgi:DNA-binding SARP family transcriptional activator